jgi:hypothetical protein
MKSTFESIVARADRWMRNRFITTVMVTPDRNENRPADLFPAYGRFKADIIAVGVGE